MRNQGIFFLKTLIGCCLIIALIFPPAAKGHINSQNPPDLIILFTGDGRSMIEPNGCCTVYGGMAKRATRISEFRENNPRVVVLDSGDYLLKKANDPVAEMRPEFVHQALAAIGYDALNIGNGEMTFGNVFVNLFAKDPATPLVSANIVFSGVHPKRHWPAFRIINKEDIKIGVIGLTKQTEAEGFIISDPVSAALSYLPQIEKETDIIVLLSHLNWLQTKEIVQNHGGIDLAIVGYDNYATFDAETVNATLMAKSSFDGGTLGVVRFWMTDERKISRIIGEMELLDRRFKVKPEYVVLETDFETAKKEYEKKLKATSLEQQRLEASKLLRMSPEQIMEHLKNNKDLDKGQLLRSE